MHCVLCGGKTEARLVETDFELKGERLWLIDVPAEVCLDCHEPYFEMAIYDEMALEANRLYAAKRASG